jgi:hypothetical protein
MLRILSFVVAVAAIMAIPFSQADARHGGMSGGRSFSSGGMRMGSTHMSSTHMSSMRMSNMRMSNMRSGPRVGSFNTFRGVNRVNVIGNRRIIVGNRRIHRGRFFVGVGAYGLYDTCWRWVPSVYGYRRVWVCDPYDYY